MYAKCRLSALCCLPLLLLAAVAQAQAKPTVVVLTFGGSKASRPRGRIVKGLARSYEVLPGDDLLDACEQLGVQMARGPNLARCAKHIRAIAVVGGQMAAGQINLAVYAGKTGEAVATGGVPWTGRGTQAQLKQAVGFVASAIQQAPALDPPPSTDAEDPNDPDVEDDAYPDTGVAFDPGQIGESDEGDEELDPLENPLAQGGGSEIGASSDPSPPQPPRLDAAVWGMAGIGMLIRQFSFDRPVGTAPRYDSGAAAAIRLAALVRPLAFFTDGPVTNLFASIRYLTTLGLESQIQGSEGQEGLSTSISELLLDVGYRWNIMKAADSLRLDFGLGFGMQDFSTDWPPDTPKTLPDTAYRFLRISVGGFYPFTPHVGAHLAVDYRMVFSAGEIQDDAAWYGPSFTGGVSGGGGLDVSYKGFIATVEYTYTHFFYSFSEKPAQRSQLGKKAAAGANDQYHALMLSLGYSY